MKKAATIIVFQEDLYNTMYNVLFSEALNLPDVYLVVEKDFPETGIYKFLPSKKLKALTLGLSNRLYLKYFKLPQLIKEISNKYDEINILFHNASLTRPRYPLSFFKFIKNSSVKLHLLYLDKHSHQHVCSYANYLREHNIFDNVMTFDPEDAEYIDALFCYTPYSKLAVNNHNISSQLYFCGSNCNRIYTLYKIWSNAKQHNVSVRYDIFRSREFVSFFENDENIRFEDCFFEYPQIIGEIQKSRCILDITQPDQSGFTLRPYEAVVYNKKLLTNNKRIFEFPFYDVRYMRYFESVDDIDFQWINDPIDVDYKYNGEFSPIHLINTITSNKSSSDF